MVGKENLLVFGPKEGKIVWSTTYKLQVLKITVLYCSFQLEKVSTHSFYFLVLKKIQCPFCHFLLTDAHVITSPVLLFTLFPQKAAMKSGENYVVSAFSQWNWWRRGSFTPILYTLFLILCRIFVLCDFIVKSSLILFSSSGQLA